MVNFNADAEPPLYILEKLVIGETLLSGCGWFCMSYCYSSYRSEVIYSYNSLNESALFLYKALGDPRTPAFSLPLEGITAYEDVGATFTSL